MLFLPLQEPLPAGRAPAGGVEIAAHRVAHDLELGADVGGLDQQLRLVIVGHEELHDAGAILRGRHAAVGIREADVLRRAAVQRPGLGRILHRAVAVIEEALRVQAVPLVPVEGRVVAGAYLVLRGVPYLVADGALPHVIGLHVQGDVLPVGGVVGAAHHAVVAGDVRHQQEAQAALAHAVAELGEEALRVQGEGAAHAVQHGGDARQLRIRAHAVRQGDILVAQRRRLAALGGQEDADAVGVLQRVGQAARLLQAVGHVCAVYGAPVGLRQRAVHRQGRGDGRGIGHRCEGQLRGIHGVEPEGAVLIHRAHQQLRLRQIAAGVHLPGDAHIRQAARRDMCACGVQRGAPRCHAHEVGGAGEGVQVAGGVREQGRIGEEERIAAAGQGGIAHFVVVKGQQGHGIARQRRLIALGAQHGQLPGGHVQQSGAALAAVGRQEELHRHAPGSRVKGGDIQYPQVAGQGHSLRLPAVHLLAEKHTVPQEVICAAVKGEIAVHVLGRRPCARLRQTAAEKLPDDVFPVAQGEAVGQRLLLQIPHAVQHRLLPHGVGIGGLVTLAQELLK